KIEGGEVAFSLEAPAPDSQPRRFPWLATAAGTMALVVGAAFGAAAATPGINMIAAPSRVFAGVPLEVPYAYRGWASMRYTLKTADGRQLAAGLTRDREGTLKFAVPSAAGTALTLDVAVAGPFGQRSAVERIGIDAAALNSQKKTIAAAGSSQPPRISEFAIETPSVHAGGTIAFTYSTNAPSGDIWLVDDSGRLWASTPIDASGKAALTVPQGAAGRQLRAVMRAKNGKQDAVASLAVTVLPGALVAQSPAAASNAAPTPAPPASLTLSKVRVVAGETIAVSIDGARGDASLVLNDSAGTAVESGDIADGQTSIAFTAPSRPGVYYVVANVTAGNSQQTLVKTLTVK
ncbi:MAG TPA: PPC domain-containing protein, partial [Vicinamibacterales bacterium]|nr:PPC domain-containing protein [Vicinamibacterales bacterium]